MSTKDRDRFARARRELVDALELWRMLAETPEDQRDETLAELVVMAERSLADCSEEFLQAGLALGYPRASASASASARARPRPSLGSAVPDTGGSSMRTEDLMALADFGSSDEDDDGKP